MANPVSSSVPDQIANTFQSVSISTTARPRAFVLGSAPASISKEVNIINLTLNPIAFHESNIEKVHSIQMRIAADHLYCRNDSDRLNQKYAQRFFYCIFYPNAGITELSFHKCEFTKGPPSEVNTPAISSRKLPVSFARNMFIELFTQPVSADGFDGVVKKCIREVEFPSFFMKKFYNFQLNLSADDQGNLSIKPQILET